MDFQQPASFKLGRTSENGEEKDSRPLESTVKIYVQYEDSPCIYASIWYFEETMMSYEKQRGL